MHLVNFGQVTPFVMMLTAICCVSFFRGKEELIMPIHSMFRGVSIPDMLKEFSDSDEDEKDPEETFFKDELGKKERS